MAEVGIASPWMTWAREVHELFRRDTEVEVEFDNDERRLTLRVANASKADALGKLLPERKEFGNVVVNVDVVPANEDQSEAELFRRAFAGNPAVWDITVMQDMFGSEIAYVQYEPSVVSFQNDDISDLNGYTHTLFQEIAKDTFDNGVGVRHCTALKVGDAPLGEWP